MNINWPEELNEEAFLRDYWQKQPLLIRGAVPDFDNPLSPDELGGLALDEDIHSRLILRESDSVWHLKHGPFEEEELTSLPPKDWSLLISDVEKHLDGFAQYLAPFRFIPDWRIDDLMISYAPSGASVGPHIDQYDVFLFQAAGKRDWSISTGHTDPTLLPELEIRVLANFQPTEQWVLEPGDMLYLPPGIPHHGVSADNDCTTWSIGFRAPSHADLIADIAQQLSQRLDDSARYTDPNLKPQSESGEITQEVISTINTLWKQLTAIDGTTFTQLVGNALTQRSSLFPPDDTQQEDSATKFTKACDNTQLQRDSASRVGFTDRQGQVNLHVDGKHYPVTRKLASRICAGLEYDGAVLLSFCDDDRNQQCLLDLWRRGLLYIL